MSSAQAWIIVIELAVFNAILAVVLVMAWMRGNHK